MELVRCLDTLTPSYFKSSDDGWLEKRSERIAHIQHPADIQHVSFKKKNDWQSLIKLESDLANAE